MCFFKNPLEMHLDTLVVNYLLWLTKWLLKWKETFQWHAANASTFKLDVWSVFSAAAFLTRLSNCKMSDGGIVPLAPLCIVALWMYGVFLSLTACCPLLPPSFSCLHTYGGRGQDPSPADGGERKVCQPLEKKQKKCDNWRLFLWLDNTMHYATPLALIFLHFSC